MVAGQADAHQFVMILGRVLAGAAVVLIGCGGGGGPGSSSAGTTSSPSTASSSASSSSTGPNPIFLENAQPGTANWALRMRSTQHEIEAYTLRDSAAPGDTVPVAISVKPGPFQVSWSVYRIGYYGGIGARLVAHGGPVTVDTRPSCPIDRTTGLVACGWPPSFTLQTDPRWITGLYLIRLDRSDGWGTWAPLVLRSAAAPRDVLMIVPTSTWQAYNSFEGESLYIDTNGITGSGRAFQVSFDRPYGTGFGTGDLLRWDQYVARWLERNGVNVAYATDADVDRDPSLTASARAIVLSGHDEYWTTGVRDAADAAVANGTSLLLFGANAGYWHVRYAPSSDGRDRRVIVCYKDDARRLDPVGPTNPELTVQFRQSPVSRPENALFGIQFQAWNTFGVPYTIADPTHWALTGTGLTWGDTLPLVGGYEIDSTEDNGSTPGNLEVIAGGPFVGIYGGLTNGMMVVRQQGNAIVFAAGGIGFAAALDGPDADPRVQRIAWNVLSRALGRDVPADALPPYSPPPSAGPYAQQVTTLAGVPLSAGSADGPLGTGRLRQPVAVATLPGGCLAVLDMADRVLRRVDSAGVLSTLPTPQLTMPLGLASDPSGNLYLSDAVRTAIWKIDPSGRAAVIAGTPDSSGVADGPASTARFLAPAGLSLSGTNLYVADIGANAIRKIDLVAGTVTTIAPPVQEPSGVAVGPDGIIYAIETAYQRVVAISGGQVHALAGGAQGFADGPASQALLLPYLGLAVLPDGALAVSDAGNYRVRLIRAGQVSTLAGSGRYAADDGTGDVAGLILPTGLTVDANGRLYVADTGSSSVRRITR